jgi:hypothetical protein
MVDECLVELEFCDLHFLGSRGGLIILGGLRLCRFLPAAGRQAQSYCGSPEHLGSHETSLGDIDEKTSIDAMPLPILEHRVSD